MLGLGNTWFVVAGLCADVVGFSLLAWDLLPEYRISREFVRLLQMQNEAKPLVDGEKYRVMDSAFAGLKDDVVAQARKEYDQLDKELRRVRFWLIKDRLQSEAEAIGKAGHEPFRSFLSSNIFNRQRFEMCHEMLWDRLRETQAKLAERKRPPLRLGIGLVIVGFLLQIWGTIPL